MRIAKYLSQVGLCSRREAERWITDGRVKVDGVVLTSPAVLITEANHILVDDKPISTPSRPRLWLYNKPRGLLCTHKDPQGRPTVFDALPFKGHIISIGRLDLNTEGLLLLTNNGELARYCELPQTGWKRHYQVRVFGDIPDKLFQQAKEGLTIDGVSYREVSIEVMREGASNVWLYVTLCEGKNREIRKIMEHFGLTVSRLRRLAYGPFSLGELPQGKHKEVHYKDFCGHFPFLKPLEFSRS